MTESIIESLLRWLIKFDSRSIVRATVIDPTRGKSPLFIEARCGTHYYYFPRDARASILRHVWWIFRQTPATPRHFVDGVFKGVWRIPKPMARSWPFSTIAGSPSQIFTLATRRFEKWPRWNEKEEGETNGSLVARRNRTRLGSLVTISRGVRRIRDISFNEHRQSNDLSRGSVKFKYLKSN